MSIADFEGLSELSEEDLEPSREIEGETFHIEVYEVDGIEYLVKDDGNCVWKETEDGYECLETGRTILTTEERFSVHYEPEGGWGDVNTEDVPVCPYHEPK